MNTKPAHIESIPDYMLTSLVLQARDIHTKVTICLSGIIGDYKYFTVLQLAQELATRSTVRCTSGSLDVAKLEAEHAELLEVLKTLTECWNSDINEVLFWHNKPRAYIIGRAIERLREAIAKAEREQTP